MLTDTIAAISTAAQEGAISIIRISGDEAISIADQLFSRSLSEKASHTITYGYIIDPLTKEAVDEVLVSLFRAPRTEALSGAGFFYGHSIPHSRPNILFFPAAFQKIRGGNLHFPNKYFSSGWIGKIVSCLHNI